MKYINYFNTLLILMVLIILMGFFKYFFNIDKNNMEDTYALKYFKKKYFKNILLIPDTYFFIQKKKIYNEEEPYLLYLHKIFDFINEALKFGVESITIDFINKFHIGLMGYKDFRKISDPLLWNTLFEYAKKMQIKINFIYNKSLFSKEFILLLENIQNKINNDKNSKFIAELNFLIGYDVFEDIKESIISITNELAEKHTQLDTNIIKKYMDVNKIKKKIYRTCKPFDIVYACANSSLMDTTILHCKNAKIINLNYTFDDLSKQLVKILLRNTIFNSTIYLL